MSLLLKSKIRLHLKATKSTLKCLQRGLSFLCGTMYCPLSGAPHCSAVPVTTSCWPGLSRSPLAACSVSSAGTPTWKVSFPSGEPSWIKYPTHPCSSPTELHLGVVLDLDLFGMKPNWKMHSRPYQVFRVRARPKWHLYSPYGAGAGLSQAAGSPSAASPAACWYRRSLSHALEILDALIWLNCDFASS